MANVIDYLKWRGDTLLEQVKFNEIDNLILARVAYFPFDKILSENDKKTVKECYEVFKKNNDYSRILLKDDTELFEELSKSDRFKDLYITNYINKIDKVEEKQFSAITIELPNNYIYVSYRGTDNTLVGWKEDFNLSFKENVPAQIDAVEYLEKVEKTYNNAKIIIGGHSKGGNLAVYAAAFASDMTKKKIEAVYNNDGPGFCEKIIQSEEYKNIVDKVKSLVPQSSVVGRLLNHKEEYTIVKSTQVGIMQHDLYSWQLIGSKFETLENVTNGSEIADKSITNWLEQTTPEQREIFVDVLFDILNATNAKTLAEIKANLFQNAKIILTSYKNIDEQSKEIINKTIRALLTPNFMRT